ncbi:MipA/OmpV family protein [Jannaschia aquimarina]|uniref:MipA protein n=1 Tax=Jannaschia aquimarina TaxID=935700 RepID=A0A0D1D612_9RHOB|nr:MipA/OmpV family protein [Jannaschia aquimarina]KIT15428.1 MltA-interacting protein precursor [Jannaschia aquimarina]SNT22503.1 outer membrane protein [Jannaschia aquimarina]
MIRILTVAMTFVAATPLVAQETLDSIADPMDFSATASSRTGGPALGFTLRTGVSSNPRYFGDNSSEVGADLGVALDYFRLGRLEFGSQDPYSYPEGFGITGSFRYIGKRDDDDSDELAGLDDVDASLELGAGLRYATRDWQVFGNVRYGVIGHESFVGELGADAFLRPSDRLTLRLGPRALFGSDEYVDTYFGVTPEEAAASAFDAYDPDSGLVSTGVELGAGYRFNDTWGLDAAVRYERLRGDAADSPIVQDDDQVSARIGVTRRFTFGF